MYRRLGLFERSYKLLSHIDVTMVASLLSHMTEWMRVCVSMIRINTFTTVADIYERQCSFDLEKQDASVGVLVSYGWLAPDAVRAVFEILQDAAILYI